MVKETIDVSYKNKSGILQCSNPATFRLIREKFSVPNPNYKLRKFSARKYVITPAGAFEVGLWNDIHNHILKLGKPVDLRLTPEFKLLFRPSLKNLVIQELDDGHTYYDYQLHTIQEFLKNGRGIGLLSTSAGKTRIMAGLCKTLITAFPDCKILIVVPNTSLLNQTYYSFVDEFKVTRIERWGDKNIPEFDQNILIANMQILSSDLEYTVSVLKDYDYVIVDEVHRIGDKESWTKKNGKKVLEHQLSKIIHNIDTPNKWGLTGTLPDKLEVCWNILGKIGPILYEKSSYEVRQQGTAADVKIHVMLLEHSEEVPLPVIEVVNTDGTITMVDDIQPNAKYNAERVFLYQNEKRNDIIRKLCKNLAGNTLVIIDNIEHGEILQKVLESTNKIVYFIRGSVKTDDRMEITKHMEREHDIVCIAMSQCFSTGVSIKNLHNLIIPSIGKSSVKIMQTIGRMMRLHDTKDIANVYDIADDTKYSKSHLKTRLLKYKSEKLEYKSKRIKL